MLRRPVYSVYQVFTPTSHARLNFVPRDTVSDDIVDVLRTPGKQLVVYGESGSGKSTLLLKLLEQTYPDHITTQCSLATKFDQLILNAFDQLDAYYVETQSDQRTNSRTQSVVADFFRIKATIEAGSSRSIAVSGRRVVPPQLTAQRLGQFLGALGLCWVIEDFHKMNSSEKLPLAQSLRSLRRITR